jgi:hypothetical protein
MTEEKTKLLLNGIASIADATDINFWEIKEALEDNGILDEDALEAIENA